jgi:hypothetical protein
MPVFESGDLIIGELYARAVASPPVARVCEVSCGVGGAGEVRNVGSGGYILGVVMKIPLLMSSCVSKSLAGPPTKSYPGH